jgi:hypothetical protein
MHIWPAEDTQEMWFKDDVIFIWDKPTNVVHLFRIKERFLQPPQYVIDKYSLTDEDHWHYNDDTRVFSVCEGLGNVPNTEEDIQHLLLATA